MRTTHIRFPVASLSFQVKAQPRRASHTGQPKLKKVLTHIWNMQERKITPIKSSGGGG